MALPYFFRSLFAFTALFHQHGTEWQVRIVLDEAAKVRRKALYPLCPLCHLILAKQHLDRAKGLARDVGDLLHRSEGINCCWCSVGVLSLTTFHRYAADVGVFFCVLEEVA